MFSPLPRGAFPGVDEVEVFEFLESQRDRTPGAPGADAPDGAGGVTP